MSPHEASRASIILATIDFSDSSTEVIEQALDVASHRRPVELHFLHVGHFSAADEDERQGRHFELLEWLGARLPTEEAALDGVSVVAHEVSGDPQRAIIQMARDLSADLVVLGTHGRKGLERLVMGSVAEAVSRQCGCSVLVVRRKLHDQHHAELELEPACAVCVEARIRSQGAQPWCHDHSARGYAFYDRGLARWVRESFAR